MPIPSQLEGRLWLPVVAAPMFLVSGPELVIAAGKAGTLGTFPALNLRTTELFEEQLVSLKKELTDKDAPYGVNLIVHRSNPRVEADLEACVRLSCRRDAISHSGSGSLAASWEFLRRGCSRSSNPCPG